MTEATTTTYPAARDPLPDIGPNTPEDGAGVEHDVVHAKAHALLNKLQDLIGLVATMPERSVLERLEALEAAGDGGGGTGAVPLLVPAGTVYTVAADMQALFALPIELEGDAAIVIDGALVEVN